MMFGGGLLAALAGAGLCRAGHGRKVAIPALFVLSMLPVLGFIPFVHQDVSTTADRYVYLGLLALAWGGATLAKAYGPWARAALAGVIILYAVVSWRQISFWQKAHDIFAHTLAINPHSGAAKNMLGWELLNMGQYADAIPYFVQAVTDRPGLDLAYNNLGVALDRVGRKKDAIDSFRQALKSSPDFIGLRYNLANTLRDTGETAEAEHHYLEVLKRDPSHSQARFNLALMLLGHGRADEALIHFTVLTQSTSLDPDAHVGRGDALYASRQPALAVAAYNDGLRLAPTDLRIRRKLALALYQAGRTSEAITQLALILRELPGAGDIVELKLQMEKGIPLL